MFHRLQLFHLIEFTGKGGKSLYVDGFNVANQLRQKHPWAYKALSQIKIPTHCAGDAGIVIKPTPRNYPILNLNPKDGTLYQVRFNNDDRSVFSRPEGGAKDIELFYAALNEWMRLARHPDNEVWLQLRPGLAVVMDNWRVLHGRSEFTGHRRMCGSYINWDDYRSRVRTLCYGESSRFDI